MYMLIWKIRKWNCVSNIFSFNFQMPSRSARLVNENCTEDMSVARGIVDAIRSLEQMSAQVETVVSARLDHCQRRFASVNDRLKAIEDRINQLKTSNQGTVVLAPTKRPGPARVTFAKTFFPQNEWTEDLEQSQTTDLASDSNPQRSYGPGEKQLYYNVKVGKSHLALSSDVPANIWSISNVLLFNSADSPYLQTDIDSKLLETKPSLPVNRSGNVITTTSTTISSDFPQWKVDDWKYSPAANSVPQFDVPDLLPDLPGVVDLPWAVADLLPPIATNEVAMEEPIAPPQKILEEKAEVLVSPIPETIVTTMKTSTIPIPPPPPPPPVPQLQPLPVVKEAIAESSDDRSSLMDAIRKAGGAKGNALRTPRNKPEKSTKQRDPVPEPSSKGGDIMADLAAALVRRRRGMSGGNEESSRGGTASRATGDANPFSSALAKIAEMIPPEPDEPKESADDWNSE